MSAMRPGSWRLNGDGYRVRKIRLAGHEVEQREHRVLMEQFLGRALTNEEHVHHINGDKADNRIENLDLVSAFEHKSYHKSKEWINARQRLFHERRRLLKENEQLRNTFAGAREALQLSADALSDAADLAHENAGDQPVCSTTEPCEFCEAEAQARTALAAMERSGDNETEGRVRG